MMQIIYEKADERLKYRENWGIFNEMQKKFVELGAIKIKKA